MVCFFDNSASAILILIKYGNLHDLNKLQMSRRVPGPDRNWIWVNLGPFLIKSSVINAVREVGCDMHDLGL